MNAVLLNYTLKPSPQTSNTEALLERVVEWFDRLDTRSENVRVVDHDVRFGVTSDEGHGDQWPRILDKVLAADYWVGHAGPGPSYLDAGGDQHPYTQKTTKWMAHNLVHFARVLKERPIPPEGNTAPSDQGHTHGS